MKVISKLFLLIILSIFLHSCTSKTFIIDDYIDKIKPSDFDLLKNRVVYFRSRGHSIGRSIYFVNLFNGNCSPYSVEVENTSGRILKIDNNLVLETCGADYLTISQIEEAVQAYLKLNLCVVMVDENENIYISPQNQDRPNYLRKSVGSNPKDIGEFVHYRGDWYIRK